MGTVVACPHKYKGKIKGFDIDTISALTKLSKEEINYTHKQKTL